MDPSVGPGSRLALSASGWPIEPGRRVRLRVSIWDDGAEGHHPPGHLAHAGDVCFVRERHGDNLYLTHHCDSCQLGTFLAYIGEVELYWEQPDLFPQIIPTTNLKENHP